MNPHRYVICDIEATGLHEDKEIIEIALITFQDGKVTDVFDTLINPLKGVSEYIQQLTSISRRELESAPKFYDIADVIRLRLEGSIFVSHNTDFDFNLLQKKFQELGQDLKVKTFCTLKSSQQEIPGLKSYNLDALCAFFGIKIKERHRAIGDARATLELFKELLQLRTKTYPKPLFLPHHEKSLKELPARPGLLHFKDKEGRVIFQEAAPNMEKRARELLRVEPKNGKLLVGTEEVKGEVTGSPLIAEFKKLQFNPFKPHWIITVMSKKTSEKFFTVRPYKKGVEGLWYFKSYKEAKHKLKELENKLKSDVFIIRDGEKSKEEIFKRNQKIEMFSKDVKFPNDNLIIFGEGRVQGESSFILVRSGHVHGYGYTDVLEEELLHNPEAFVTQRYSRHVGADLTTKRYIKELKNMRQKSDKWRSLAQPREM